MDFHLMQIKRLVVNILSLFLLNGMVGSLFAQPLNFLHIGIEEGLSHPKVNAVYQDSRGFVWFGTRDGLNVYDGYKVESLEDQFGKVQLKSRHIQSLHECSDGNLWIGTFDGGLSSYNPRTGTLKTYMNDAEDKNSISSNNVYEIKESIDGKGLWIGTFGGGLSYLDKSSEKFSNYKHNPDNPLSLPNNSVFSIVTNTDGSLWLGTFGDGLVLFDTQKGVLKRFTSENRPELIPSNDIYSLYKDKKENLWIGTYGGGLVVWDQTKEISRFHTEANPSIASDFINIITEDDFGNIWIGMKNGGVAKINNGKILSFRKDSNNPNSLPSNDINDLYFDRSGVMWIGTDGHYVSRFIPESLAFEKFIGNGIQFPGFVASSINAVYEDKNGNIWIGTFGDGLFQISERDGKVDHYIQDFYNPASLSDNFITSIAEGNRGEIWIGTNDNGISIFNVKNKTFQQIGTDSDLFTGLPSNSIERIFKDKKNNIWVGTYGGGLAVLKQGSRQFITYQPDPGKPSNSLVGNTVKVIFEDSKGNIWLGTKEEGVSKFDPVKKTFINFRNDKNDPSSIKSNSITGIAEDRDGNIWISTFDQGILILNEDGKVIHNLSTETGLVDNFVCEILSDESGFLWASTTKGLVRIKSSDLKMKTFTTDEGLHNNEFVQWSAFKNASGELFFGGLENFVRFSPQNFLKEEQTFPLVLRNFLLYNEKKSFTKPLFDIKEIVLNHDDNFFEFEFALLNTLFPDQNQYSYFMEGLDKRWNNVGNRRVASYTNLDAKEYVFRVKAADKYGNWTEDGIAIKIIINPAWYNTWWARLLAAFILVWGGLTYYRNRIKSIVKQKQLLEQQVAERTAELVKRQEEIEIQKNAIEEKNKSLTQAKLKIEEQNEELKTINDELEDRVEQRTKELKKAVANLKKSNQELDMFIYRAYHDIKGPIASIEGLCHLAKLDIKDKDALQYIGMLNENSEKTVNILNRILNIYDIRNTVIAAKQINLLAYFEEKVVAPLKEKYPHANAKVEMQIPKEYTWINDENLLNKIYFNLFENCLKYSKNEADSFIRVEAVSEADGYLSLRFIDNGHGIDKSLQSKLFSMFFRGTTHKSGAGLGLFIAKAAVDKLQGSISFIENNDGLTIFEVTLPDLNIVELSEESEIS